MATTITKDIFQRAKQIRLLVLDVDGVLTDGSIIYTDAGEEIKCFHVRDGHGIRMVQQAGIDVALITGRQSAAWPIEPKICIWFTCISRSSR